MTSVSCLIPHLRDSIIHTNIKPIPASSIRAKRGIARKVSYVLSFTENSSKGMYNFAINCSCMKDWFLQKVL